MTVIAKASRFFTEIGENETVTYSVLNTQIPVRTLRMALVRDRADVSVSVVAVREPEKGVDLISSPVYAYLWVYHGGVDQEDFKSVALEFDVAYSWLEEQGVTSDEVRLHRLEGERWTAYDPRVKAITNGTVTFVVEVPGLSYFAIGLPLPAQEISPTVLEPVDPVEVSRPEASQEEEEEGLSHSANLVVPVVQAPPFWAGWSLPKVSWSGVLLAAIVVLALGGAAWGGVLLYSKNMKVFVPGTAMVRRRRNGQAGSIDDLRERYAQVKEEQDLVRFHVRYARDRIVELKEFVARAYQEGYEDEAIEAALKQAGWDDDIIHHMLQRLRPKERKESSS
ncbi:MAG: PGF-pre-PGF domain-containing protein [Nitrosarchaeum sp.]|nr:PGF-pre-PGF domain-containing protein [Nitrosarchaeum sp.]